MVSTLALRQRSFQVAGLVAMRVGRVRPGPMRRPVWPRVALLGVAVLVAHLLLLDGLRLAALGSSLGEPERELAAVVVTLTEPTPKPRSGAIPPNTEAQARAVSGPAAASRQRRASTASVGHPEAGTQAWQRPKPAASVPVREPAVLGEAPSAAVAPEQSAAIAPRTAQGDAQTEVPIYPTRLPASTTLHFSMQRGALGGDAELVWRLEGGRYEARFESRLAGVALLTWESRGGVDSAGVAPERFVDRRWRRSAQAANFRRYEGKISFSGRQVEYALTAGTQDRLSWMVQLAAIAQADPRRLKPGAQTVFHVAGARGDVDTWVFEVLGRESVDTAAGPVEAVKLLREPRLPYDTRAEVWLDPAHDHLPVRARLGNAGSNGAIELLRR